MVRFTHNRCAVLLPVPSLSAKNGPRSEGITRDHLLQWGEVTREEADEIAAKRRELLEKELSQSQKENSDGTKMITRADVNGNGSGNGAHPASSGGLTIVGGPEPANDETQTGVSRDKMKAMLESLSRVPEKFHPHPKLKKFLQSREEMATGQAPLDWAAAEALAFGTLAADGTRIRMSGQDSERGTFSHRHAVLHDYETGEKYFSLQHLPATGRLRSKLLTAR